jgi:aspartate 1-decarboxylase
MDDAEAREYRPRVVFVDEHNHVLDESADPARVPDDAPASSLLVPGTRARAALN